MGLSDLPHGAGTRRRGRDRAAAHPVADVRPVGKLSSVRRRGAHARSTASSGLHLGRDLQLEAWLERLLIDLSIRDYFHVTVVSGRAGIEKPHPEIFRLALEGAGVDPEEAVHVGDNPNDDVAGAEAVGIRGVLLDRSDRFAPVLPTNRSGGEASGR